MTALPDDLKLLLAEEPFVRRLARQLVADEADDVVQQTWLRALQARGGPIERPRHWLARVLRNVVADRRRREQRRQLLQQWTAPEGLVPSSSELLAIEERRRELVAAVDALPSPLRTVVLLRYYDGLPPRRIAAKLGLPATTVWNRLHDGLQQLRQRLHARHGERRAWVVPFLPFITSPRGMPWREVLGPAAVHAGTGVIAMTKTKLVVGAAAVMVAVLAWTQWPALDAGPAPTEGPRGPVAPVVAALDAERMAPALPGELGRAAAPDAPAVAAKTGTLLVHVRYGSEPHTAAGLAVRIYRSLPVRVVWPSAITDDDGTARFPDLAPGLVWVHTNVRPRVVKGVEIEAGAVRECSLELAGGMTLRGVVVDPHGVPVAGALLELTRPHFGTPAAAIGHSASDGTFVIRECDTEAVIGARAAGHAASQIYLVQGAPGSTQQVHIELQPAGGCVAGVVVDAEGQPVEGATVRVGAGRTEAISVTAQGGPPLPAQVATDRDGRFLAIGVREGTQPLHAFAAGHAPWQGSCDAVAGTTVHVRVALPVGVTCEGTVLDQDRRPLAGVTVRTGETDDLARYAAQTDENGAFAIRGLPAPETTLSGWDKEAGKGTVVVRGAAGETVHVELVLSQGLQLRGRVVDETGAPAHVHVFCSSTGAQPWRAEAICDERGQFRLGHCPVGCLLSARITERGYLPFTQQGIDPAAGEVVLKLQRDTAPGAKIVGRLLLPDGSPAAGETVSASRSDVLMVAEEVIVAGDGSFAFEVPAGSWGVHANVASFAARLVRWQPVQPGATWDVGVLQLARGGALIVTGGAKADDCLVVDPNGDHASDVDALVGPPRSRLLLHPGDYLLLVKGENVTAQAIPFTIRDGEDTKLVVPPLAGVSQRFLFVASPGTELPKWVACDVRRDGKLCATCGPNQRDGDRIVMNLWLAPGSYTLATRLREQPSTASFVVGAQEGTPVRVELR
ncbi:MAG TPA: sigma-70 family RNA polymerase sigma factor [Planctomycetota bacterium]|nr:sigma-70 family RNA polymerase sigma factor [Planctomycetota bacterium]